MGDRRSLKIAAVLAVVVLLAGVLWYLAEPWTLTFIDDGPYYSTPYPGPVEQLAVDSQLELHRFGRAVYRLESRALDDPLRSVLVLRRADGSIVWALLPEKPDGELGTIGLRNAQLTWNGGWRVGISPSLQEGGALYLGAFGRFRFFNHSW